MPVTLQYPSKCALCKEAMAPGTAANWIAGESGSGFSHTHINCPDPSRPEKPALVFKDVEELFSMRKCSECGQVTGFKAPTRPTPQCPYCEGQWIAGNPTEVAWAA